MFSLIENLFEPRINKIKQIYLLQFSPQAFNIHSESLCVEEASLQYFTELDDHGAFPILNFKSFSLVVIHSLKFIII